MIKIEIFRKLRAYYRVFCFFTASKYKEVVSGEEKSFKDRFLPLNVELTYQVNTPIKKKGGGCKSEKSVFG